MSQALKTRINNLAAEVAGLRAAAVQSASLTVKGDDQNEGVGIKVIDSNNNVRALKGDYPYVVYKRDNNTIGFTGPEEIEFWGDDATNGFKLDGGLETPTLRRLRSLKGSDYIELAAEAGGRSIIVKTNQNLATILEGKQNSLTFSGDDTLAGGFRLKDNASGNIRRLLVSGNRLTIQQSPNTLTLGVADSPTFTNLTALDTLTAAAIAASNGITGTYQTVSSNTTLTRSVFGGAVLLASSGLLTNYTVTLPPLTAGANFLFLGPNSAFVTVTLQGQGGAGVNGVDTQTLTHTAGVMWMVRADVFYWSVTNMSTLDLDGRLRVPSLTLGGTDLSTTLTNNQNALTVRGDDSNVNGYRLTDSSGNVKALKAGTGMS